MKLKIISLKKTRKKLNKEKFRDREMSFFFFFFYFFRCVPFPAQCPIVPSANKNRCQCPACSER